MASLTLQGSTSGQITLATPAVAGTNTITLPAATGTVLTTAGGQTISGTVTLSTLTSPAATNLTIQSAGTTAMTIDTSQNILVGLTSNVSGVGSAAPGRILSKAASAGNAQNFLAYASANDAVLTMGHDGTLGTIQTTYAATAGYTPLTFNTGGSERMRIDSSGNVGIGTSSPSQKLDVVTVTSSALSPAMIVRSTSTGGYSGLISLGVSNTVPASYTAAAFGAENTNNTSTDGGRLKFYTAAADASHTLTERMRIEDNGNVLVGGTTSGGTGVFSVIPNSQGVGASPYLNFNKSGSGGLTQMYFQYNGSTKGSISYNDTATSFNTTSDYRLKQNIQPMQNALATVSQLNPVTYIWKENGSAGQGFIAHELQAVVPDCVTGEKDAVDENGKPIYQGVDTSFLVATLVKAIQELKTELDALKGAK